MQSPVLFVSPEAHTTFQFPEDIFLEESFLSIKRKEVKKVSVEIFSFPLLKAIWLYQRWK